MIVFRKMLNPIDKKYVEKIYGYLFFATNIAKISSRKWKKIFRYEDKKIVEIIKLNLLDKWVKKNYQEDIKFFNRLKRLIKKMKIKLTQMQRHDINLLEERIFSSKRHIKVLLVDMDLKKGEVAGIKFTRAILYRKTNVLKKEIKGDLIATNFRLIINFNNRYKEFYWKDIKDKKYMDYGFAFRIDKKKYVIRIHDQITLNNTLQNFITKKIK